MTPDPFDLDRFVSAQEASYATALSEITSGMKRSHCMWLILSKLQWLGSSAMAQRYGIAGMDEAIAYIQHPVLGPRLLSMVEAMCQHKASSAEAILGGIDARKFHSCLTLFSLAAPQAKPLQEALDQFFSGEQDLATLDLLAGRRHRAE